VNEVEDAMKAVIGILVVSGVVVYPVAQMIGGNSDTVNLQAFMGLIDTQTNLVKIASSGDTKLKYVAKRVIEMGALNPAERALYPNTLTGDEINYVVNFLEKNDMDVSFISSISSSCQKWLIFTETGKSKFSITPDILDAYYSSIIQKKISSLKPAAKVSEVIYSQKNVISNFCGNTCTTTIACGDCWKLRQEYLDASDSGDIDKVLEIDTKIRESSCAVDCAEVCSSVYNSYSTISGSSFMGIDISNQNSQVSGVKEKTDFIDLGIGLP